MLVFSLLSLCFSTSRSLNRVRMVMCQAYFKADLLQSELFAREGEFFWELIDPVVADPVRQDNDKGKQYTNIYGNSLLKYTEGGDKTSQYSYLVAILSNWVPDNWVYLFRFLGGSFQAIFLAVVILISLTEAPPRPHPTPRKRTRNGSGTDPKRTRNGPKRTRNGPKSSSLGWDGRAVCREGGGGCKGKRKALSWGAWQTESTENPTSKSIITSHSVLLQDPRPKSHANIYSVPFFAQREFQEATKDHF